MGGWGGWGIGTEEGAASRPQHDATSATLASYNAHAMLNFWQSASVVMDFGRSMGLPRARSHTSAESTPMQRDTPVKGRGWREGRGVVVCIGQCRRCGSE